jgi:carbon dioxide concentrating mechanism protein CcmL
MQIAKVRGTVVSTHKLPGMTGVKLLLVQFIDEQGQLIPQYEVAADRVGAGLDEWVLVSRRALAPDTDPDNPSLRPIDALIVGIIDTVTLGNALLYSKKNEDRY